MKWTLHEQGEPNQYTILDESKKHWFAFIHLNGELTVEKQRETMNKIVDLINNQQLIASPTVNSEL
jgi:hypothetical protein